MTRAALHALRLIWREPIYKRQLSTAVVSNVHSEFTSNPTPTLSSHSSRSEDFLEPESNEYQMATMVLPPQDIHSIPIPWPTLFPSSSEALPEFSSATAQKPCDLLARLAAEGDVSSARAVYDEMKALHLRIQHRSVYLDTALAVLDGTSQGKKDFLLWLELYPNRPATKATPSQKKTWQPIVNRLCRDHAFDLDFLSDFLKVAGKKGLLPSVLPRMLKHITMLAPPSRSKEIFEYSIQTYRAFATSSISTSERAAFHASIVDDQISTWSALVLRYLILAGWTGDAMAFYESRTEWDQSAQKIMWEKGLLEWCDPKPSVSPTIKAIVLEIPEQQTITKRVKSLYDHANGILSSMRLKPVTPRQLNTFFKELDTYSRVHPIDAAAFHHLFQEAFFAIPHSDPSVRRKITKTRRILWWHAEIVTLQRKSMSKQAVASFLQHFIWSGIPDHPIRSELSRQLKELPPRTDEAEDTVLPSLHIICSLLPSLLSLLPPASVVSYHAEYLASIPTLPPFLKPDELIHLAFLREILHKSGPEAGIAAIQRIINTGLDPGAACWNAVIISLAGQNKLPTAFALLDAHRNDASKVMSVQYSERTFEGMVHVLQKIPGSEMDVEAVRKKMVEYLGVTATPAADASGDATRNPTTLDRNEWSTMDVQPLDDMRRDDEELQSSYG